MIFEVFQEPFPPGLENSFTEPKLMSKSIVSILLSTVALYLEKIREGKKKVIF